MSTVNLKAAEVQVRENRLGSITGFEGTAAKLVQCARCGELTASTRSFSQCIMPRSPPARTTPPCGHPSEGGE